MMYEKQMYIPQNVIDLFEIDMGLSSVVFDVQTIRSRYGTLLQSTSQLSFRRFIFDLWEACKKGYIVKIIRGVGIQRRVGKEYTKPICRELYPIVEKAYQKHIEELENLLEETQEEYQEFKKEADKINGK